MDRLRSRATWSSNNYPGELFVGQAYMAIIHGARGLLYFHDIHPSNPDCPKGLWPALKQVGEELFGEHGIVSLLLPPSQVVEFMGETGIVSVSDEVIHMSLFANEKGKRALIAFNPTGKERPGTTFDVQGLKSGSDIRVRFENRTIKSGDGSFTDAFGPYDRRVYDLD